MRLVVGCPVYKRAWILPNWLVNVEAACSRIGIVPWYVFVGDPRDKETVDVIDTCKELYCEDRQVRFVWVGEEQEHDGRRVWNPQRYQHMVELRNALLRMVRAIGPDYFLSLDSDILLHPHVLENLLDSSMQFDAVGGKTYLSKGRFCPSYAFLAYSGGLKRDDSDGVFPVDVIMAIKLMKPVAYAVDYQYHQQGEDIGWSINARNHGVKLGWDGRLASKHVMHPDELYVVDKRVGY